MSRHAVMTGGKAASTYRDAIEGHYERAPVP
jgi:hypothetical protein